MFCESLNGKYRLMLIATGILMSALAWAADPVVLDADLRLVPIEPDVYMVEHRFPGRSNSLLVRCSKTHFVWVDTPLTDEATAQVHKWIKGLCDDPNIIQINTGFHNDNLAGNGYLRDKGIPCYGSDLTVELLRDRWPKTKQVSLPYYERIGESIGKIFKEQTLVPPDRLYPLKKGLKLKIAETTIEVYYPGPSHTLDNVVVYFKPHKILFGGCMIKSASARTPGFTFDADMEAWPESVKKVIERYPRTRIVVPGHGRWGDRALLTHTVKILEAAGK